MNLQADSHFSSGSSAKPIGFAARPAGDRRIDGAFRCVRRCRLASWLVASLLAAAALLILAPAAHAQDPALTDHSPVTNSVTAPLDTNIVLTYSAAIDAATVTSRTVAVHSMMQGLVTATHSVDGNVVTVDPDRSFFAGELVYTIATTQTTDINGTPPSRGAQWQFSTEEVTNRCVDFVEIDAGLTGVSDGDVVWGDYDNDGDLDLVVGGFDGDAPAISLYRNDGSSGFTPVDAGLTALWFVKLAWGDFDNDGDLDLVITGRGGKLSPVLLLYRNDAGAFTEVSGTGIADIIGSSAAWGDYDNDGFLDLLLTGWDFSGPVAAVYRNNGDQTFSDIGAGLTGVYDANAAWGDYDNDGDLDILLAGADQTDTPTTLVYRNDEGAFVDIDAGVTGVYDGNVAWGDYDNDGDLDFVITGRRDGDPFTVLLYENTGGGNFTEIVPKDDDWGDPLPGKYGGMGVWGDYDNDGVLDLLLTGDSDGAETTYVYWSYGDGWFWLDFELAALSSSRAAWGDYDGDGDIDLALMGDDNDNGDVPTANIYRNDTCPPWLYQSTSIGIARYRCRPSGYSYLYPRCLQLGRQSAGPNRHPHRRTAGTGQFRLLDQPVRRTLENNTVTWTGSLEGGEVVSVTFAVTNTASGGLTITNTAYVSGSNNTRNSTVTYTATPIFVSERFGLLERGLWRMCGRLQAGDPCRRHRHTRPGCKPRRRLRDRAGRRIRRQRQDGDAHR